MNSEAALWSIYCSRITAKMSPFRVVTDVVNHYNSVYVHLLVYSYSLLILTHLLRMCHNWRQTREPVSLTYVANTLYLVWTYLYRPWNWTVCFNSTPNLWTQPACFITLDALPPLLSSNIMLVTFHPRQSKGYSLHFEISWPQLLPQHCLLHSFKHVWSLHKVTLSC